MRARGHFQGNFTNLNYVYQQSVGLCLIPTPKPMIHSGNCMGSGTVAQSEKDHASYNLEKKDKVDKM